MTRKEADRIVNKMFDRPNLLARIVLIMESKYNLLANRQVA